MSESKYREFSVLKMKDDSYNAYEYHTDHDQVKERIHVVEYSALIEKEKQIEEILKMVKRIKTNAEGCKLMDAQEGHNDKSFQAVMDWFIFECNETLNKGKGNE